MDAQVPPLPALRIAIVPGVTPGKWVRRWEERVPDVPLTVSACDETEQTAVLWDGRLALIFALQGAPDLALTQFLVETLTLVTFVLVLRKLPKDITERHRPRERAVARSGALLTAVLSGPLKWSHTRRLTGRATRLDGSPDRPPAGVHPRAPPRRRWICRTTRCACARRRRASR